MTSRPDERSMGPRRGLRRSLLAGGAYDLLLGLWIVLLGGATFRALGAAPPEPFLLRLAALPLFLLPALYWTAARAAAIDPFRAPVLWARGGGGAIVLLLAAWDRPEAGWVYALIGLLDLGWWALHAVLWRR